MTDDTERWLPVGGFESLYEVSDLGRVQSMDRIVAGRNRWGPFDKHLKGKILAQRADNYGYQVVTLFRDGKSRPYRVHRLVGEAFLGPRPAGMDTRHGPAGRQVNAVTNLCYGSRAENEQDKIRDGTFNHGGGIVIGERHGRAKLTGVRVTEMRQRRAAGETQVALALAYGITQPNVSRIIRRETWTHVQ